MKLHDFNFNLPKALIATHPLPNRDDSRMLIIPELNNSSFKDIVNLLNSGDALVLNNTRVIPSRIFGICNKRNYEATLHKEISDSAWQGFIKNSKKLKIGDIINFSDKLYGNVIEKGYDGVILDFQIPREQIFTHLEEIGKMPLPPYMNRQEENEDKIRYQTVFGRNTGSVASPTASLHFTDEILQILKDKGVHIIYVTLHVGAGTFLPVKQEDISLHKMHSERGIITKESADLINEIKLKGGKITAVGTTALRVLESATDETGKVKEFNQDTNIFITPGYKFKIIDQLLTNFHTPCSTLFMLTCAFAGYEIMKQAYQYAIEEKYRFYSYGDCCFLKKA